MELMQRLGTILTDEYVDSYIEQILKYPGSCDNVWIPTMYGFPSLENHRKYADFWKAAAEKFRKNGISVSMQISNSIGHGKYMSARDCSGLVYEGSPVEKMVGPDGIVADYCFCWRGKNFRKYLLEEISYYTEIKPDCIWVDDDFRASNHDPVQYGCFCDDCIRKFNEKYSADFNRETLVAEILHGDIKWRENYVRFIRDGLYDLMYEIGKTVHEISPETSLGYQYCAHGAYTGYNYDFIFDAMRDSTGHNPKARPGGGVYNDHNPNDILSKCASMNWQNSTLPDYVECKCPEIENTPFNVFGKSPSGTAFETTYYFANGNTDMSYSMIMKLSEPMEWHSKEFELFSQHRRYWDKLSEFNKDSYQSGIHFFMSQNIWKKELAENEGFNEMNSEHAGVMFGLLRTAIPIAYDRNDMSIVYLHPETAKVISYEELEFLLTKNVITDAESIEILLNKGHDFSIRTKRLRYLDIMRIHEEFTSHKVNPENTDSFHASPFTAGRSEVYTMDCRNETAEIIGEFKNNVDALEPFFPESKTPYGVAELVFTTEKGAKWAVSGYVPWKGNIPLFKRDHQLRIADYISGKKLCAKLLSPVQAVLSPRKDKDGKVTVVSITNCTIGESGELELFVRNPASENFTFMSQYNGEKKLDFTKDGDDYIIKVPSINPWSVGTVFINSD